MSEALFDVFNQSDKVFPEGSIRRTFSLSKEDDLFFLVWEWMDDGNYKQYTRSVHKDNLLLTTFQPEDILSREITKAEFSINGGNYDPYKYSN